MGAEKTRKPFFKNWINWLWLTPTLISVVFILHQVIFQLPRAKQFETKIQREFSLIPPLPGATQKRHNVSHRTSQALVDATYVTNVEVANIFKHYNDELTKQGWQFYGVRGMKDWGKDLGGKSFYYCKLDYTAHLQYAGQQADYGWTYAFSISWGLGDCKTQVDGGFTELTILHSLLCMVIGFCIATFAGYFGRQAWTKSSNEYLEWLRLEANSRWEQFLISINKPKSLRVWTDRIGSAMGAAMGLVFFLVGAYSLWLNIAG